MSVQHIGFNPATPHGFALRQALDKFRDGLQSLKTLHAAMVLMQDSGNSTSYIVDRFGFTSTTAADAAVAELGSMLGKLTTDGSVSNTAAAIAQAQAKFE